MDHAALRDFHSLVLQQNVEQVWLGHHHPKPHQAASRRGRCAAPHVAGEGGAVELRTCHRAVAGAAAVEHDGAHPPAPAGADHVLHVAVVRAACQACAGCSADSAACT